MHTQVPSKIMNAKQFLNCFGSHCKIQYRGDFFTIQYTALDGGIDTSQCEYLRKIGYDITDVYCRLTTRGIETTLRIEEFETVLICTECEQQLDVDDCVFFDGEVYHKRCIAQS